MGYGERGRQDHRRRQSQRARHRARRLVWLQHAGVGYACAADPGAHDRRARDLRCNPFGAAAGREGHVLGRRARIRAGAGAGRGCGWRCRRVHRDPSRSRSRALRRAEHGTAARVRGPGEAADGIRHACQASGAVTSSLPPALNIIALTTFAASLSGRALDPVLPHVADEFGVSIASAAGFSAVFAFTFAIVQPVLGAAADMFGKARLMTVCLVLLGIANILGALSNSYSMLFVTRILAGIGSGGVFPVSLSLVSDLVGPDKRQVAIGRTLAGSMAGNLLGATLSGLIGDFLGWRGVLTLLGALELGSSIAVAAGFRGAALARPPRASFAVLRAGYRTIFNNPNAKYCYAAVFIEGCCVLGLFPFVASFLFELGETRL